MHVSPHRYVGRSRRHRIVGRHSSEQVSTSPAGVRFGIHSSIGMSSWRFLYGKNPHANRNQEKETDDNSGTISELI